MRSLFSHVMSVEKVKIADKKYVIFVTKFSLFEFAMKIMLF